MMARAYYNEIDPYCVAWLRNLIKAGLIADGDVDDRDIRHVQPGDLRGYSQCHFFAGLGGWSYALRLAGWPDDKPVWTGSCPCQPFSAAGKRKGFADDRHLWPDWYRLIRECRPTVVFGEQTASKDGLAWLDLVQADLERSGYAVGAADLCAAGVEAPHIRQRLWFVANMPSERRNGSEFARKTGTPTSRSAQTEERRPSGICEFEGRGAIGIMGDACSSGGRRHSGTILGKEEEGPSQRRRVGSVADEFVASSSACVMGDTGGERLARRSRQSADDGAQQPTFERAGRDAVELAYTDGQRLSQRSERDGRASQPEQQTSCGRNAGGCSSNLWVDAEWLECADGKARPVEPGTFPLAYGVPARVAKLRALGNAIVPQVAAEFVMAYCSVQVPEREQPSAQSPFQG